VLARVFPVRVCFPRGLLDLSRFLWVELDGRAISARVELDSFVGGSSQCRRRGELSCVRL